MPKLNRKKADGGKVKTIWTISFPPDIAKRLVERAKMVFPNEPMVAAVVRQYVVEGLDKDQMLRGKST